VKGDIGAFHNAYKMKSNLIIITSFLYLSLNNNAIAQNPTLLWAKSIGAVGTEGGYSIAVDATGNVYTTGYFQVTVDFDPGPGTYNMTAIGTNDIFISKIDASGNFVWARQLGGTGLEQCLTIAVDGAGKVHTTGYFTGTVDFDPGPGSYNLTSVGPQDIFVSKLDASGNFLFAIQFSGTASGTGNSIKVDGSGNIYTTGIFGGTFDFDPGPGTYSLTGGGAFVSKLDPSGNFLWANQFASPGGNTNSNSIFVDISGNVYSTGNFTGTVDFDPGPSTFNLSSPGFVYDIFVSKLDASGNFVWAEQMGDPGINDLGLSITVDATGNVYTTGNFQGTADFDPGPGTFNLTSAGLLDIFISKLDVSGNFVWAKRIGSGNNDDSRSITVDNSGNVYTTGFFYGSADFDPGLGTYSLSSAGQYDIFISKLDASGNFLWAKRIGGTDYDEGYSVAIDATGNVYLTGDFRSTADFDPGSGTYNLTSAGDYDIFVVKLGEQPPIVFNPNFLWAKDLGGASDDVGRSIVVDANRNVYTTGYFQGTSDFDPGPGIYNLTSAAGSFDIFISKLNASGNFLWAKQLGGVSDDRGNSIAVDANGNVFTTGYYSGIADFDPGSGTYNLTSVGYLDIFVSKVDASGNFVWAKSLGGSDGSDAGSSIIVDISGNIYTTGYFHEIADFDPGPGTFNLTSVGNSDIFVSKLDASGDFVWAKGMGGTNASGDIGLSIVIDINGNSYTTGYFCGTADFDPGSGTYNLTSAGDHDVFVSKLDVTGNFLWAKQIGGVGDDFGNSITVDVNGNIYITGNFIYTVDFDPGPGTYNLTSYGENDIFVSKLNTSGNFLWAKQIGGIGDDRGHSIAVDNNGSVYTTGFFLGTIDFDPGSRIYNLISAGLWDIFLSKLDSFGNFLWARQMGGGDGDYGNSIKVDETGNVHISGWFGSTADFDPGPGTYNLTSAGANDIFVVKLEDPLTLISPQIFLDKALIQYGQTDVIWGKNFTSNGQIKINIGSQSPNTNLADTIINANSQGYFNFTYYFVSSLAPGVYNILATDLTTLKSSYLVRLVVVSTSPVMNRDLKITSPIINTSSKVNKSIKIAWSDIPSHISTLIPNKSQVNAPYKIEYNRDNAGWQLIEIKSYPALYQQQGNFQYNYTPSQTGAYQFRVTDMLDAMNSDVSSTVNVNDPVAGVVMNFEWDFSGNRPSGITQTPIGVAADGTARIYVKIEKKSGNNKTISQVIMTVSDPQIPTITDPRLLGKLKEATVINTYSLEANAASQIAVTSTTSGPGNIFWFWYVAPDDFVRVDNDTMASSRKLNLEAIVTFSDNSIDNVTEQVEIVRPPLMLVHGIGGDENTWNDFYYTINGGPIPLFFSGNPLWKISRALSMEPGGSFSKNGQILITPTDYRSFQHFLRQMRNNRYSCNRVDYVAHSMGGDIARTTINLFSAEYKPSVNLQRTFRNYDNGFINKLITLNTPHNGSPLADWIISNSIGSIMIKGYMQNAYLLRFQRKLLSSFFKPFDFFPGLNFTEPTEALQNLRFGTNGVKFLQSSVKNLLLIF
jgi:pimeloyl-ACP methyl ester carboxylesterase